MDPALYASRFKANLTLPLITAERGEVMWNADALLVQPVGNRDARRCSSKPAKS
ncbi:hypothetical protein ABZ934_27140 [Streptomyces sp. NPDC046557]|uniref:hypothetical protein n=1 Tax=Streptomyces sp. NPDC046557 TaxID=3155372 RepID=UPI0034098F8A